MRPKWESKVVQFIRLDEYRLFKDIFISKLYAFASRIEVAVQANLRDIRLTALKILVKEFEACREYPSIFDNRLAKRLHGIRLHQLILINCYDTFNRTYNFERASMSIRE